MGTVSQLARRRVGLLVTAAAVAAATLVPAGPAQAANFEGSIAGGQNTVFDRGTPTFEGGVTISTPLEDTCLDLSGVQGLGAFDSVRNAAVNGFAVLYATLPECVEQATPVQVVAPGGSNTFVATAKYRAVRLQRTQPRGAVAVQIDTPTLNRVTGDFVLNNTPNKNAANISNAVTGPCHDASVAINNRGTYTSALVFVKGSGFIDLFSDDLCTTQVGTLDLSKPFTKVTASIKSFSARR